MISVKFSYWFFHFFSLSSLQFLNFQRLTFVLWIIHTILFLLHVFLRVFLLCNLFFFVCFLQFPCLPFSLLSFISYFHLQFSSVSQLCWLFGPIDCSTPGFPVYHQHPELAQTHVHQVSDAIQQSHPLPSLLFLPSIFPSIRVFSNESVLGIKWPKFWSFNFSISYLSEYPRLISFGIDWFELLAVQGTLKSLLQHHSSNASVLWRSVFFTVQLSSIHDHWKKHSLD